MRLELDGRRVVGQQEHPPWPHRIEPVDEVGEDARVPRLERLDLLVEVAGVAGLVRGLDVDEEQVGAGVERPQGRVPLALVVRVEPAVAPGTSTRSMSVSTPRPRMRSTAVTRAAWQPVWSTKRGIWGWKPWPQSHTWLACEAEVADDLPAGVHDRLELGGRRAGGPHRRLVGQVVRRRAVGVGPVRRRDEDVAVLHAGVELDVAACAPSELRVEGVDDRLRLLGAGWPPAKSSIVPLRSP